MKTKKIILLMLILAFNSCNESNDDLDIQNETVIIDNSFYKETTTNNYTITNIKLESNFLTIKISSSGCSGDSWQAVLVDANEILESNPIQRNIKLALENQESCLAVFENEFTFDISELKDGYDTISLNLEGWNTQIFYN